MRPSGLGEFRSGNDKDAFAGRITPSTGTTYLLTGGVGKADAGARGQILVDLAATKKELGGLISIQVGKDMAIREDAIDDRHVGDTRLKDEGRTGFAWKGGFLGRTHKPDGTEIFVAGSKQAWGKIVQSGGVYWGQITDGKPDGCGVWDWRNQPKEVGFYVAGARQSGELPEDCRRPHYQRPVDIDAVAKNGAQALPQ
jgi:hypothetical protein